MNCICFLCASIPLHLAAFRAASSEPPLFCRFNAAYCRTPVVPCIPFSSPSCLAFLSFDRRRGAFIRPPRIHDVTITPTSYYPPRSLASKEHLLLPFAHAYSAKRMKAISVRFLRICVTVFLHTKIIFDKTYENRI